MDSPLPRWAAESALHLSAGALEADALQADSVKKRTLSCKTREVLQHADSVRREANEVLWDSARDPHGGLSSPASIYMPASRRTGPQQPRSAGNRTPASEAVGAAQSLETRQSQVDLALLSCAVCTAAWQLP